MIKVSEYRAEEILAMNKPGDLFTNNPNTAKAEWKQLSKVWHPDVGGNNEVMKHINNLYEEAGKLFDLGKWEKSNSLEFTLKDRRTYRINYQATYPFELGDMYICNNVVVYIFNSPCKEFYDRVANLRFTYPTDNIKQEMEKYLPQPVTTIELADGRYGITYKKSSDLLLLQDVLNYYNKIPDRHVAWILSSLYNVACYLDVTGMAHNGITTMNYFISPKFHGGALLGGWWYAGNQGDKMIGMTKEVYEILPPKIKDKKQNNIITDLESIRSIGRKLLRESGGYTLRTNTELPKAFIEWLLAGSSAKAVEEYKKWSTVLDNSYGPRKFVVMELSANDLYK